MKSDTAPLSLSISLLKMSFIICLRCLFASLIFSRSISSFVSWCSSSSSSFGGSIHTCIEYISKQYVAFLKSGISSRIFLNQCGSEIEYLLTCGNHDLIDVFSVSPKSSRSLLALAMTFFFCSSNFILSTAAWMSLELSASFRASSLLSSGIDSNFAKSASVS